ncbi:MAG: O-methyltransferase [Thiohalospira sp.]
MFSSFKFALNFLKYWIFAKHAKGHGIHSPFIFDLITNVFNNKKVNDDLKQIYHLHKKYMHSTEPLIFDEMGAGSHKKAITNLKSTNNRDSQIISTTIGKNIRNSSVSKKYGGLIYRLVKYFNPENILEIGTSLGISTMYIAKGAPKSTIITIEGVKVKIQIAQELTKVLKINNINFLNGNFNTVLPEVLKKINTLDFVFFDGNHNQQATLKYFDICLAKAHNNSVFVFDDIHWSADMEKAWDKIKKHKKVSVSIDLFRMGIIFFRKEITKGHYKVKF